MRSYPDAISHASGEAQRVLKAKPKPKPTFKARVFAGATVVAIGGDREGHRGSVVRRSKKRSRWIVQWEDGKKGGYNEDGLSIVR